jgi:arginine exporter protein ArgO
MKKWMVFVLAFVCVIVMIYAGLEALSKHHERTGMFLTFVGSMTIIGLALDFARHLKTRGGV